MVTVLYCVILDEGKLTEALEKEISNMTVAEQPTATDEATEEDRGVDIDNDCDAHVAGDDQGPPRASRYDSTESTATTEASQMEDGVGNTEAAEPMQSPSLIFDLSEGEEEPDMGHNVWRESVLAVCGERRGSRGEDGEGGVEKQLDFTACDVAVGEDDMGDDGEGRGNGDGKEVLDEPQEEAEECTEGAGCIDVLSMSIGVFERHLL